MNKSKMKKTRKNKSKKGGMWPFSKKQQPVLKIDMLNYLQTLRDTLKEIKSEGKLAYVRINLYKSDGKLLQLSHDEFKLDTDFDICPTREITHNENKEYKLNEKIDYTKFKKLELFVDEIRNVNKTITYGK